MVHMRVWRILVVVLALVLTVVFLVPRVLAVVPPQPDIIVVMVDDLGAIDERILERLPNIRSLFLEGGLRLDNAYAETPLCCPGRATFLTGQHTRNHHVTYNAARLLDPSRTIATALRGAGYHTAMTGKYLNGAEKLADLSPAGWDHAALMMGNEKSYQASPLTSSWIIDNQPATLGYRDRATLDLSVAAVAAAPLNQPLFLWSTPRAPHWGLSRHKPWQPAIEPRYASDSRCNNIAPWKPAGYSYARQPDGFPLGDICRALLTVDEMVGDLVVAQSLRGREAVWLFTSDNGMAWGWHGFPIKNVPEAGRLPIYFAGAGVVGGSTDALVSNIDLAPTLAALGGTSMPWADGTAFLSLLSGGSGGRDWMLEDHPKGGYTAGPWRAGWKAVRTPVWYLLYRKDTARYYLYDLVNDPAMNANVKAAHRTLVAQLKEVLP